MHKFHRFLVISAIFIGLVSTGCVNRVIHSVSHHGTHNVTLIRTTDHSLLGAKRVSQFWSCSETADQIECRRDCGAKNQHACREALFGYTNLP